MVVEQVHPSVKVATPAEVAAAAEVKHHEAALWAHRCSRLTEPQRVMETLADPLLRRPEHKQEVEEVVLVALVQLLQHLHSVFHLLVVAEQMRFQVGSLQLALA